MLEKIKNHPNLKLIFDTRNLGLYVLLIITLSVTWSSVKTIKKNYEIEKQITILTQQVEVLEQQTKNQVLKNEYYKTDAFLELAARKYFAKALPGEQFIPVPSEVANKYTHPEVVESENQQTTDDTPTIIRNWQSWIDFFSGQD